MPTLNSSPWGKRLQSSGPDRAESILNSEMLVPPIRMLPSLRRSSAGVCDSSTRSRKTRRASMEGITPLAAVIRSPSTNSTPTARRSPPRCGLPRHWCAFRHRAPRYSPGAHRSAFPIRPGGAYDTRVGSDHDARRIARPHARGRCLCVRSVISQRGLDLWMFKPLVQHRPRAGEKRPKHLVGVQANLCIHEGRQFPKRGRGAIAHSAQDAQERHPRTP